MRVECLSKSGLALPIQYLELGYSSDADFDLEIGKSYRVYGMCLRRHCLAYLIDPDGSSQPNWYPAILFSVQDHRLPTAWMFSFTPEDEEYGVSSVWGYDELACATSHFDD